MTIQVVCDCGSDCDLHQPKMIAPDRICCEDHVEISWSIAVHKVKIAESDIQN